MATMAEAALAVWLVFGIRRAMLVGADADRVLAAAIERHFGQGITGRLMAFEARLWFYALFMRKAPVFEGERHFSTARAGGNASNQLAWIWLMVFDIPVAHMLLHFLWPPAAAWIATALTAWGLLYLLADYRATWRGQCRCAPPNCTRRRSRKRSARGCPRLKRRAPIPA